MGSFRAMLAAPNLKQRHQHASMNFMGRFRNKREIDAAEQITAGTALPDIEIEAILFDVDTEGNAMDTEYSDVASAVLPVASALGNGTTVLVGMPGAFTPTCTDKHLPSFIQQSPALKALGVQRVAVLTTNDRFVNSAWNKAIEECMATKSSLLMLSDGDGDLVKAMGLVDDMGFGMGVRSKRFALVVKNGIVENVLVDEGYTELENTSADAIIELLSPKPAASALSVDTDGPSTAVLAGLILALFAALYYYSPEIVASS